ncbi:MAG: sodium/proline symporter PutP, partial [Calditrichia bacterium]
AGTYLNWKFVAKRLRQFTRAAGDSLTLPDYFSNRFENKTQWLRLVSAIFILIFFLIYTASGFVGGAKLFNTVFGLPYFWALSIGVLVIIMYTFLGGFLAVSWTDFVQGLLMFFAILVVPVIAIADLGGPDAAISQVQQQNPHLLALFSNRQGQPLSFVAIISLLAWGLGYFGQPHILARFMAIRSSGQVKRARLIAMIWVSLCLSGAVLVGIVGMVYLPGQLQGPDTETVFMLLVNKIFHPLMAGILLSAILAAIMSTADSQLLVASSALTEDLYRVLFRRTAADRELVMVNRLAVLLIALCAFFIALDPQANVLNLVAYAWAGFGAAFGPLILFSLYWRRMTYWGAFSGVVTGGLTVLIWKQLHGGLFDMYEIVPGFLFSSLSIIIVSLLNAEPAPDILKKLQHHS